MTRKKVRRIPTDEELVRDFTGQKFKDFLAANWPGKTRPKRAEVERYALSALADARIYIRDAVKPEVKTTGRPMMSPIQEAATGFAMYHQLTFYQVTGVAPPNTASRTYEGPFLVILRECLLLLKAPSDHIRWVNTLQKRSNTLTDEKGQDRRPRKNSRSRPE